MQIMPVFEQAGRLKVANTVGSLFPVIGILFAVHLLSIAKDLA